ncbi:MAG: aminomethyl-transferring glycine dehydrogenase subunit GcvPB [Candidatus Omnitrophica bacterium]|nr:aminomethyl-transferring glycine dehydrogenase subunit GcvPB [Candidatus Omnitrophota bacterium]MCB9720875.1 aminomethyl-transferring glycine dehydrogenase subunit GcvPB [Candidatus Omnitrophota bacterium]
MQLIFEKSVPGQRGFLNSRSDVDVAVKFPVELARAEDCPLPELSELEVVRHYTNLSKYNFSIDTHFYPLGSCTMKYNPKFCEEIAQFPEFTQLHPLLPQLRHGDQFVQGALEVLYELEKWMCEMTGMDAITMQPLAGAHGELTGVMMMAAYHKARGNNKKYIIVPDSAHGTNPATARIAGYETIAIPSDANGVMDLEKLKECITEEVAGLMLTCPNTHGLFNSDIDKIAEMIHAVDGIMYYDGANLNAILGRCRPGDIGFDVMHINTHKTFTTPHGGGGPGAGPVGVTKKLTPYLPVSRVIQKEDGTYALKYDYPDTIGYIASFYGNFGILLRAYAYILLLGEEGLRAVSDHAVLNANYIKECLRGVYHLPFDRRCMHEVVFSAKNQAERGVHALDIAKFLIDQGFHPPTVYFPLTVKESIMIEPTETESKATIDAFIEAMMAADQLSRSAPEKAHQFPATTPVTRPDEVKAARDLNTSYFQQSA